STFFSSRSERGVPNLLCRENVQVQEGAVFGPTILGQRRTQVLPRPVRIPHPRMTRPGMTVTRITRTASTAEPLQRPVPSDPLHTQDPGYYRRLSDPKLVGS